jgi:hypothetical protein
LTELLKIDISEKTRKKYYLTSTNMENFRLDKEKYMDRLQEVYPQCSKQELTQILLLRLSFWEMIIDDFENLEINY